jgi:hypothetical protein
MRFAKTVVLIAVTQLLVGCVEFTHLTRERSLGNWANNDEGTDTTGEGISGKVFFIDAKQRGIFVTSKAVCAEPSPDALSALAASGKLDVATPQGTSVGAALSLAEAAGSIGLRTQSIQLLRDHMYRVCEAYQGGAISRLTYELLHRRFQTTMVAILAIEQLTGVTKAPTIVLGGNSAAGDAEAMLKLTATRETAAASVETAKIDYDKKATVAANAKSTRDAASVALAAADAAGKPAAQTAFDDAEAKYKTASEELTTADGTLAGRKAALAAVDRAITLAGATSSASASGAVVADPSRGPVNVAAIADAVQKIVHETMTLGNTSDFCVILLSNAAQKGSTIDTEQGVGKACLDILNAGGLRLNFN